MGVFLFGIPELVLSPSVSLQNLAKRGYLNGDWNPSDALPLTQPKPKLKRLGSLTPIYAMDIF